jgi:simple sugar transport system permease protein
VDLSLVLGIGLLALFWFVMKYTRWGLEMRSIGGNPAASRRNGIPVARYLVVVMCVAGALAGLAGMAQVSGYYGVLLANFSRGLGYMGFLVSWLAGGSPLGIVVTSFVVAVILSGGNLLQLTGDVPYSIINILLAMTLFVVLARPRFSRSRRPA